MTGEDYIESAMLVRAADAGGFVRSNAAFQDAVGFDESELGEKPFVEWLESGDRETVGELVERGGGRVRARHCMRSGDSIAIDVHVWNHSGEVFVLACPVGMAATPVPSVADEEEATLRGTLDLIARIVEDQNTGYRCSILLVEDGRFVSGAGPSLPEDYNAAIDGYAIGPAVGSCGTAIYWNVPVIVHDIQKDPLWAPLAELAAEAGVGACWSHPFTSRSGHVLGALALYAPEPREPTEEQLRTLRGAARMTGLAVERGYAEDALREQRRLEQELEEQLRLAAKMEALGVLAGGVAHDFNNVLAVILGNAELALELLPPNSEVDSMMRDIIKASRRAGGLCGQMLAYAGRDMPVMTGIELASLIPQVNELLNAAVSKKTDFKYSPCDEPLRIVGDEKQLLQVLLNLVTNAAEAIGDGEGQIEVALRREHLDAEALRRLAPEDELPPGEYARLTVSDTGCGIDADAMWRVFDPFYSTKFAGRGLGLAAVKGIVKNHRGAIAIESEPGAGTAFVVLLPAVAEAPDESDAAPPVDPDARRIRVLVAEDEAPVRDLLRMRLEHSGFEVLEARDGQEAIELFLAHRDSIECALIDLSMPKRDGDEVYRELRAARDDLPVVLMSSYSKSETLERLKGEPISGFLQKPIMAEDMVSVLRSAATRGEKK